MHPHQAHLSGRSEAVVSCIVESLRKGSGISTSTFLCIVSLRIGGLLSLVLDGEGSLFLWTQGV